MARNGMPRSCTTGSTFWTALRRPFWPCTPMNQVETSPGTYQAGAGPSSVSTGMSRKSTPHATAGSPGGELVKVTEVPVDGTGPSSTARVTVPPSRAFTSPSMVPAPLHSSQYVPGLRVSGVSGRVTVPLTEARTRRSPGPHRRTLIASSLPNQAPYPAPVTRTARATPAATNARRLQRRGLRSDTVEDPPRRTYAQRPELLLGQPDPAAQIELHQ